MKPKGTFEKSICKASDSLPPISDNKIKWGYRHAVRPFGRRHSDGTILCTQCGKKYKLNHSVVNSVCPHCHTHLQIVNAPRKRKFEEKGYFAVVDSCNGYQVIRYVLVYYSVKVGCEPVYEHCEVMQRWIAPDGQKATFARLRQTQHTMYYDLWMPSSDLILRRENPIYGYIETTQTYPRMNLIPFFKKYGFKCGTYGIDPQRIFGYVVKNNRAETLLKTGQTGLLKLFINDTSKSIDKYWASIRICIRNNYKVTKAAEWCDYIDALDFLGKDIHNAKYVCPKNLDKEHDRILRKALGISEIKEMENRTPEFLAKEFRYKMSKHMFFGLVITDEELTIKVIDSVTAMILEGEAMHHCVGKYYDKEKSLIFSATINDKRIETVEVNLDTLRVVQSHGVCNKNTPYHTRIVNLVNANSKLIKERMTA